MQAAVPYCGEAPSPAELLQRWNLDPWVLLPLAAAAVWIGLRGRSRFRRPLSLLALALLAVSFVSPLCALSSALFSARVTHHGLMIAVVAPLLAYAPRQSVPAPLRLLPAAAAHAALFWIWHSPAAYSAALASDSIYWVMQVSILGSALLFWLAVRSASPLAASGALLAIMVQTGLLGALITFAGRPLYAPHLLTTELWGLSPLRDQQLAGLIMWAPMASVYLLAALLLVGRALGPDPAAAGRAA